MSANPTSQQRRVEKINNVLKCIDDQTWSYNEFCAAFLSSKDPDIARTRGANLAYHPPSANGRVAYGPERIVDLWLEKSPSAAKPHLREMLTRKVANIVTDEVKEAHKESKLQMPATSIDPARLTTDFMGTSRNHNFVPKPLALALTLALALAL